MISFFFASDNLKLLLLHSRQPWNSIIVLRPKVAEVGLMEYRRAILDFYWELVVHHCAHDFKTSALKASQWFLDDIVFIGSGSIRGVGEDDDVAFAIAIFALGAEVSLAVLLVHVYFFSQADTYLFGIVLVACSALDGK